MFELAADLLRITQDKWSSKTKGGLPPYDCRIALSAAVCWNMMIEDPLAPVWVTMGVKKLTDLHQEPTLSAWREVGGHLWSLASLVPLAHKTSVLRSA